MQIRFAPAYRLMPFFLIACAGVSSGTANAETSLTDNLIAKLDAHVDKNVRDWIEFYKVCHANPELSLHEKESAARLAKVFDDAGIKTTTRVGGHGVVGILANGKGPTVLIRGDMDALPIIEDTGLPYASEVMFTKPDGSQVGVMHACGHDMHQTILAATAQTMAVLKDNWSGTVVFVAQPAEEIGQGARMMIEDGLFTRFPKPDHCLALHVSHDLKVGTIGYTSGWAFANVDSVDITIYGKGGHGAFPHTAVDPIVAASQLVLALQTIVSRRLDPRDTAVVTVGSLHAGTKHNIIPNEARLQLTVRSYTEEVRKLLLDSIRQLANDISQSLGCPRPADVKVLDADFTPASFNNPEMTAQCVTVFRQLLGDENCIERRPTMGGEDFGRYALNLKNGRGFMFWLGAVDEKRFNAAQRPGGKPLPPVHSPWFRVEPEPTIRTGVRCMTAAALSILDSK
ncbi:MAG: amidohydrolase [Phycisphaerales bacterium]|nr:amidohydrolase [Phycisphaerales bacterium]